MQPRVWSNGLWFITLAAGLCVAGCREADTVLVVTVVGNQRDLRQLDAEVTIADARRTYAIPNVPQVLELPASFTVRVDRDRSGPVTVRVGGLDQRGTRIAEGQETLPALRVGQVNGMELRLRSLGPPLDDAGAPPGDAGLPGGEDDPTDAPRDAGPDDGPDASRGSGADAGSPDAANDANSVQG